jgi:hypothetical protein
MHLISIVNSDGSITTYSLAIEIVYDNIGDPWMRVDISIEGQHLATSVFDSYSDIIDYLEAL